MVIVVRATVAAAAVARHPQPSYYLHSLDCILFILSQLLL